MHTCTWGNVEGVLWGGQGASQAHGRHSCRAVLTDEEVLLSNKRKLSSLEWDVLMWGVVDKRTVVAFGMLCKCARRGP